MPSFDPAALERLDNAARRIAPILAKEDVPTVAAEPRTLLDAGGPRPATNVVEIAGFLFARGRSPRV